MDIESMLIFTDIPNLATAQKIQNHEASVGKNPRYARVFAFIWWAPRESNTAPTDYENRLPKKYVYFQ